MNNRTPAGAWLQRLCLAYVMDGAPAFVKTTAQLPSRRYAGPGSAVATAHADL
jgi:hypothetical protein